MSELRWHPLLREWVTVAPARQDRTYYPWSMRGRLLHARSPILTRSAAGRPDSGPDRGLAAPVGGLGALPGVNYVYIFENRGAEIGVTIPHPHGQIYTYPFIPPRVERELESFAI